MDDRTFDRLARAFAQRTGRRALLKGLLGIGAATTGAIEARQGRAQQPTAPAPPPVSTVGVPLCPISRICGTDCCTPGEFCCDPPGATPPVCLPVGSCCRNVDCASLDDHPNCTRGICNQVNHQCEAKDRCDDQGLLCCPRPNVGICYDPAKNCCSDAECDAAACEHCRKGICTGCPDDQICCGDGTCCHSDHCCNGVCGEAWCCTGDAECGQCEVCSDGGCTSTCLEPESCCVLGDLTFCVDLTVQGACCQADTCGLEDADRCLVSLCRDFFCEPASECLPDVEKCCGDHRCVSVDETC